MKFKQTNVPALERGLQILRLFSRSRTIIRPPQIASELDIPRSTVHRLSVALEDMGFLRRIEPGNGYALGPAVLTLGFEYLSSLDIVQLSNPVLMRLRDETECSSQLGVRNGTNVIYLSRHASLAGITSHVNVGSILPAHATVMGRIMLADLSQTERAALYGKSKLEAYTEHTPTSLTALEKLLAKDRRLGCAISYGFFEGGVTSVAAAVRDQTGRAVAAVSVVTTYQMREEFVSGALKDSVIRAASEISTMLGMSAEELPF
jgi:DNA-binding IclR family transcriptional regulator